MFMPVTANGKPWTSCWLLSAVCTLQWELICLNCEREVFLNFSTVILRITGKVSLIRNIFFPFTSSAILSPQEPLSMSKWIRRIQKLSEFSSTLTNHQSSATLTFPKRNQLTEWLLFWLLISFTRWVSSYFNHISSPAGFWWNEASWDVGHE